MRKFILILLSFTYLCAFNQVQGPETFMGNPESPKLYTGLGSGLNNFCGMLGGFGEINVAGHISLAVGAGLSPWGYKFSGGFYYYEYSPYGTYFGLSFSCLTGKDSAAFPMSLVGSDSLENVVFDLKTAYTINLTLGYQIKFGNNGRLYFELGYAIPLQRNPYKIVTTDIELTDSSKQLLDFIEPGGIIVGFGFTYRLY